MWEIPQVSAISVIYFRTLNGHRILSFSASSLWDLAKHSCYSGAYCLDKNQCLSGTFHLSSFLSCWPTQSPITGNVFKGWLIVPGDLSSVLPCAIHNTCGHSHFPCMKSSRSYYNTPLGRAKDTPRRRETRLGRHIKRLESAHEQGESLPLKHPGTTALLRICTFAFLWGLCPSSSCTQLNLHIFDSRCICLSSTVVNHNHTHCATCSCLSPTFLGTTPGFLQPLKWSRRQKLMALSSVYSYVLSQASLSQTS